MFHIDRMLFPLDQPGDAAQGEADLDFQQVDDLEAADIVGAGAICHAEVGKARPHRTDVGPLAVPRPPLLHLGPLTPAHFPRPEEIVCP